MDKVKTSIAVSGAKASSKAYQANSSSVLPYVRHTCLLATKLYSAVSSNLTVVLSVIVTDNIKNLDQTVGQEWSVSWQ